LWSGAHEKAVTAAEEAIRMATPGSVSYCRALAGGLASAMLLGRRDVTAALMGKLLTTAPAPDAVAILAFAFSSAITMLLFVGQRAAAALYLDRLRAIAADSPGNADACSGWLAHTSSAWHRYATRNSWAACSFTQAAERHFELTGDQHHGDLAASLLVFDYTMLGAFEDAEQQLERIRRRSGSMTVVIAKLQEAILRLETGKPEAAMAAAIEIIDAARGDSLLTASGELIRAEAYLMQGEVEQADDALVRVAETRSGLPLYDNWARGVRARILLSRGCAAEGADEADAAVANSYEVGIYGMRFSATLLCRAEAYFAVGNSDTAKQAIREARDDLLARAAAIEDEKYRTSFLERLQAHSRTMALAREWLDP
jgi:eukaryotic-like serine/threonine-protein kinase